MGNRIRPPKDRSSYRCHGGVLDYHIPCFLRARYRHQGSRIDFFIPGFHVVRDAAQNEPNPTLQIGIFGRGAGISPGEGTKGVGRSFRLGNCKRAPRLSRLPTHRSLSTIFPMMPLTSHHFLRTPRESLVPDGPHKVAREGNRYWRRLSNQSRLAGVRVVQKIPKRVNYVAISYLAPGGDFSGPKICGR